LKKNNIIFTFLLSASIAFVSCGNEEQTADPEAMAREWCKCKKEKSDQHADCKKIAADAKEMFEKDDEAKKKLLKVLRTCD
jgi:hypothetical protein